MARSNTLPQTMSISAATTLSYAFGGGIISLIGTTGYTVTLVAPASGPGIPQTFYNSTGGSVTLATPAGNIVGSGLTSASSQLIPNNTTFTLTSDSVNYVLANNEGGAIAATSGTFTGTVSLSPANANITASPTGSGTVTINPATTGSINNMNVGATTRGTGAFTTLGATGALTFDTGTNNQSITTTGSGTITITSGTAGSINNMNVGATTRGTGAFTTLGANSTVTLNNISIAASTATLTTTSGALTLSSSSGGITVSTSMALGTNQISSSYTPSSSNDLTNKTYVDSKTSRTSGNAYFLGTA